MFINAFGHYLPSDLVANDYFLNVNGLSESWIYERTGIKTRTKATEKENTNTMSLEAVKDLVYKIPYSVSEVDLIIGASYSPYDTVGTMAHYVQQQLNIPNAKVVYISSACSSLLNAVEIAEGYFATGKASKALIIASEHNTAYSHPEDEKSGHLWGDGAAAMFVSKENLSESDWKIENVFTEGLGNIGRGPEGVYLLPGNEGLLMPYGKDVFVHACKYMMHALDTVLKDKEYELKDLAYLVPHQANVRIINNISKQLNFPKEKVFQNIEELGNTGCASTLIALSQNKDRVAKGDLIGVTVFGGGYSCGAMLVRR